MHLAAFSLSLSAKSDSEKSEKSEKRLQVQRPFCILHVRECGNLRNPRHWSLFELCGSKLSCEMLDPLLFASASPLRSALRKDPQTVRV